MNNDALLEPIKAYKSVYKDAVNEEANRYFDELVTKANIDIEANRATIKELNSYQNKLKNSKKDLSKLHTQKGFLIFGIIFFFVLAILCIFAFFASDAIPLYVSIPIMIVSIILGIWFIFIINKSINPKINLIKSNIGKLETKINELIAIAQAQLDPLNALYDWNMATAVIEKVIPILDFDKTFDARKHIKLKEEYGLEDSLDNDHSMIAVQSGNILGNPFLFQKELVHSIYNKAYTDSITISWTEYYRDSDGRRRSRTRTQVLTATTYHPAPSYMYKTSLVYGNNAAPDLSFSREPNNLSKKSDKELKKYVERNTDDLYKKAEKSLQKGGKKVFTPLANTEFELLFDALNRDHEVQFRLLYTPLAQLNTCDLLRSKEAYGDDFYFTKNKKINIISSAHTAAFDLVDFPARFFAYDYDYAKEKFVEYVNEFFKVIYFDFAPLISIPLYQQMKSIDYIYGEDTPSNYSSYEHEIFANTFSKDLLAHPETITDVIYKTDLIRKHGKSDQYRVRAYSYRGEERVDIVSKLGGDGHFHNIPVYWTEYIPLYQETIIELKNVNASKNEFDTALKKGILRNFISNNSKGGYYSFQRGMLAIISNHYSESDDKTLDSIFSKKDE